MEKNDWSLDRKIPIALIVTLVVGLFGQFAGLLIWGTATTARIDVLERAIVAMAPNSERIGKVETKVDGVQRSIDILVQSIIPPAHNR